MLSANLTLDGRAGADKTFKLIKYLPDGAYRADASTTLSEPLAMAIRHSQSGSNQKVTDRHLVQFSLTDVTDGVESVLVVNTTISCPRNGVFTQDNIDDLVSYMISFLSGGGFSASTGLTSNDNLEALAIGES